MIGDELPIIVCIDLRCDVFVSPRRLVVYISEFLHPNALLDRYQYVSP